MDKSRYTFWTLIAVVAIAGMSQGLTLPLLSVLLERSGVSSVANGINAAALYIGILLISPWLEIPLWKFGYKTLILLGMLMVTVSTLLLPVFKGYAIWFLLRFALGIGDSSLHYGSQMWVTALAPSHRRGRDISLYGFAYGAGFSVGPLGMLLLPFGIWYPFLALSAFYAIAWFMLLRVKNAHPAKTDEAHDIKARWTTVLTGGWWALMPPLLYGFMEASLNVSFPIYAVRTGISVAQLSTILPAFVVGSLVLQLPLGRWSDRVGRKPVMMVCALLGGLTFAAFPLAGSRTLMMMAFLTMAGATVGSFYSLGLAFSADVLPKAMIPTAGVVASMGFSMSSIVAPGINGAILAKAWPGAMFVLIGCLLLVYSCLGFLFRSKAVGKHADVGSGAAEAFE